MKYTVIDGIKCYAPDKAYSNDEYPEDAFNFLFNIEEKHFWFKRRNQVIQILVDKYLENKKGKFLEIGCGTGYVLRGLSEKFEVLKLQGAEIHINGIKYAKKRLPNVDFIQLDALNMPFENEYDAIGAFDVLEHIEDDQKVINEVHKSLKKEGIFIITVPQYQWMWSAEDDAAYHKRRYSKKELHQKLERSGFKILYSGSFMFTLFPIMIISRFLNKSKKTSKNYNSSELKIHPLLNYVFYTLSYFDYLLIKSNLKLPFGGSIVFVSQK